MLAAVAISLEAAPPPTASLAPGQQRATGASGEAEPPTFALSSDESAVRRSGGGGPMPESINPGLAPSAGSSGPPPTVTPLVPSTGPVARVPWPGGRMLTSNPEVQFRALVARRRGACPPRPLRADQQLVWDALQRRGTPRALATAAKRSGMELGSVPPPTRSSHCERRGE